MTRWFENVPVDEVFPLGSHTFTAEQIERFAAAYDPQYFHLKDQGAENSQYGGIIASGWHTASVGQRLMINMLTTESDRLRAQGEEPGVAGPSPGFTNMVFKVPVRAGDTIAYTLTVTSKRRSQSLPGWGLLFNLIEAHNQRGELVYSTEIAAFSKLRDFRPTIMQRIGMYIAKNPITRAFVRR